MYEAKGEDEEEEDDDEEDGMSVMCISYLSLSCPDNPVQTRSTHLSRYVAGNELGCRSSLNSPFQDLIQPKSKEEEDEEGGGEDAEEEGEEGDGLVGARINVNVSVGERKRARR